MRRLSPLVRTSSETDINTAMTPMIDVVFLLLVFFVWTASFQLVEYVLPSELSAQLGADSVEAVDTPPPDDFDDVVVRILYTGQQPSWQINDQPVASLDDVVQRLETLAEIGVQATVILHPDPPVPLGFVIQTYDAAKQVGFGNVSFAVNPQPRPAAQPVE